MSWLSSLWSAVSKRKDRADPDQQSRTQKQEPPVPEEPDTKEGVRTSDSTQHFSADQPPTSAPRPESGDTMPERLGKYRMVRPLAQGGMGHVYLAESLEGPDAPCRYAVKVITSIQESDEEAYERFKREIHIGMNLQHPNVCRTVDWAMEGHGMPYLVMELLEGKTLSEHIYRTAPMPVALAMPILRQILDGLRAIHELGVIHRDLKPGNVFVTEDGTVKLMDFGIARHEGARRITVPGAALGTPDFIAPEQVMDTRRVDHRADLFCAGLIFYQMLSKHLPFEADFPDQQMRRLLKGDRTPLSQHRDDLPEGVEPWVNRLLSHKPDDRFQTAAEAIAAIDF